MNPCSEMIDVEIFCEADEQWSFVSNKKCQHWLWYALDSQRKKVLAYVFGPRTDKTCRRLLRLLRHFKYRLIATDYWGSYRRQIPKHLHRIGKAFTQRIERHNLNLRTHIKRLARKTICFSKSAEIHEKIIGTYIERYHFN